MLSAIAAHPRRVLVLFSVWCVGLLAFGLYLQHALGLEPCPMCIVQRYAIVLIALVSILAALSGKKALQALGLAAVSLLAATGAFVAARQSWLQWYPPENASCGRDLYGMIETFPLRQVIPLVFRGSGDCTTVDWTLLGGSIANWSFINFLLLGGVALTCLAGRLRWGADRR